MRMDYNSIRPNYSNHIEELIDYLYEYYHYIVDKFYETNSKDIKKEDFEKYLKDILIKYVEKESTDNNISRYIHNRMKLFIHRQKRNKKSELIKKAFENDYSARCKIFTNNTYRMDEKAIELYNEYLNNQTIISIDDIKQMIYLEMWNFINKYFDSKSENDSFGMWFDLGLTRTSIKVINYLKNQKQNNSLDNLYYNDTYFIETLEIKEMYKTIEKELPDKFKIVLNLLRDGYTYKEASQVIGFTRSRAGQINDKIKKIVKEKDLKI